MKSIAVDIVKEKSVDGCQYGLIKLSIRGRETFCIYIDGEEYACESAGEDFAKALKIFDIIAGNLVSPIHLSEILYDIKAEICR